MTNYLRNLIVLPGGTEIFSGSESTHAIKNASITDCVNSGTELKLGSACTSKLKATIITPHGGLTISEGTEITFYRVDSADSRTKVGLFTLEKPARPSANIYEITAYDRVSWLDKDLTAEEFEYMRALFKGKDSFVVNCPDGEFEARCKQKSVAWVSSITGLYKNFNPEISEL